MLKGQFSAMSVMEPERPMHQFTATYVGKLKIDPKYKVVVGIDLGTTYSGTAIVSPDNPSSVKCGAPGAENTMDKTKTPTVLLRCPDDSWLFGKFAEDKYKELVEKTNREIGEDESVTDTLKSKGCALFRNYKMELKDKVKGAKTIMAKSTMEEPHSLLDLMTKTLQHLSGYALEQIKVGWLGAKLIKPSQVLWVLTVPAIWNDFGKAFMRKAAFNAGMIKDESSAQLLLALEPESASIAVHTESKKYNLFGKGTTFLNLDIGGGTADFTMHKVATEHPLRLDEAAPPTGGKWGGIYVDEQFNLFLSRLIGKDKFEILKSVHSVEASDLMDEFRTAKIQFDPMNENAMTEICIGALFSDGAAEALEIPDLLRLVEQYNAQYKTRAPFDLSSSRIQKKIRDRNILFFSRDQMMEFFEPTLKGICTCVRDLLNNNQAVKYLTIVGGYGSSKVLVHRVRSEFGSAPFNKTIVDLASGGSLRPQAAVVTGAAYFGLSTSVIGQRKTKYTYGIRTTNRWKEGGRFSREEAEWNKRKRELTVLNCFSSIVKKGVSVDPFQKFDAIDFSPAYEDQERVGFPVYRSESYNPKRTTESDCKQIGTIEIPCKYGDKFAVSFTFGTDIRVEVSRQDGEVRSTTIRID